MAALGRAGIAADRESTGKAEDGRYAVAVGSGDAAKAMAVLEADGLPRPETAGLSTLYSSASMIPSPTEEKARYIDALSREIAGHLETLDAVLRASVIITAPVADPLAPADATRARPTASVLLRLRAGAEIKTAEIQMLVAGAAEGMRGDDVAVVTTHALPAPESAAASFAKVGPIRVAESSKRALQIILAGALALVLLLAGWAFYAERGRASLRRRIDALERDTPPDKTSARLAA